MSAPARAVSAIVSLDRRRHLGEALGRREIGLGQRHHAAPNAEQIEDRQMLQRLRHDAVVGGDDQQREIDAARAGQHRVDEALVARHVDEAENAPALDRLIGEAEIDGDAARLLLFQPVAVDAGERFDQGRFAMVDMTGGADDHADVAAGGSASAFGFGDLVRRQRGARPATM